MIDPNVLRRGALALPATAVLALGVTSCTNSDSPSPTPRPGLTTEQISIKPSPVDACPALPGLVSLHVTGQTVDGSAVATNNGPYCVGLRDVTTDAATGEIPAGGNFIILCRDLGTRVIGFDAATNDTSGFARLTPSGLHDLEQQLPGGYTGLPLQCPPNTPVHIPSPTISIVHV